METGPMIRNLSFVSILIGFVFFLSVKEACRGAETSDFEDDDTREAIRRSLSLLEEDSDEDVGLQEALKQSIEFAEKEEKRKSETEKRQREQLDRDVFGKHLIQLIKAGDFDKEGNYIGTNEEIRKLFQELDYETWKKAFITYKIGERGNPNGLSVVNYLQKIQAMSHGKELSLLARHAQLELISGCWGFTGKQATPEEGKILKEALRGIGQFYIPLNGKTLGQKVAGSITSKRTFKDIFLQAHYAQVLIYISRGFSEHDLGKFHETLDFQLNFLSQSQNINTMPLAKILDEMGYYSSDHITIKQLIETAKFYNPSYKVSADQQAGLEEYFLKWQADQPRISENLETLQLFHLLMSAQPFREYWQRWGYSAQDAQ